MEADTVALLNRTGTLVGSFAAIYILYNLGVVIYNLYFHPLSKFPGPSSRAAFYAADFWSLWRGSQVREIKALHEKYGDVVRVRPNSLSFNTPQAFKDIYGTRAGKGQLRKDPGFYVIKGMETTHIIWSNDADHARMRKLLSHAFSDAALRQQESIMQIYFDLLIQRLQENIDGPNKGRVDLTSWYNFLTFDIIGDLCYGESFNALAGGQYHRWMKNIFGGIKFSRLLKIAEFYEPLMLFLRTAMNLIPSVGRARKEHIEFTELKTAKRLDMKTDRKDFMDYILRYNDERGMSRSELMETSGILILAGSETTATLLSGATYLLLKNPEAFAKVKAEVRNAFRSPEEITLTATAQLSYLHAVLEEALRLYPPVPVALPRLTPPEGDTISGVFVPGNVSIGVPHYPTHRSAKNFTDPEVFAPERWLPNPPAKYHNDRLDAMNPFSLGPRNCIGKNLAYNEMRSVMARMLWHFDMELCAESENWLEQDVFNLWEKGALDVKLSRRKLE